MKVLHIESIRKESFQDFTDRNKEQLLKLPKKLIIAYSIQYINLAKEIKLFLESKGVRILDFKQVLGCTKLKSDFPILLIGSGRFHALNLAVQNKSPIYIYNNGLVEQIDSKELENHRKNKEILIKKFFSAEKIGLLVSTKPGQENLEKALKFKKEILSKKKVFLFISNNINISEFENFQIDLWINSACPGISLDNKKILNIDDILDYFSKK